MTRLSHLALSIAACLLIAGKAGAADQLVNNLADGGAGSLRQAIADVGVNETVTFDRKLSGGTIQLSGAQLLIQKNLTIDASSLPSGITLDAQNTSRVMQVDSGVTLVLDSITFTGGNGVGAVGSGVGGAFYNAGTVVELNGCTFSLNTATGGGAFYSGGAGSSVDLKQCTLSGNSAQFAAGILIQNSTSVLLDQCTVSQNLAFGGTGGVVIESSATLTLNNTILADNEHTGFPENSDVGGSGGSLVLNGTNIVGVQAAYLAELPVGSPNANGDYVGSALSPLWPSLSGLADNGGPTQTMLPMAGSAAIDAVSATSFALDQRGFTRVINTSADVGAVEVQPGAVVTTVADSGAGSLRDALATASATSTTHTYITFDPSLTDGTIVLSTGELQVGQNVRIDASALAQPITIDGNAASRIMQLSSDRIVSIKDIVFTGGNTSEAGGAIECAQRGRLKLEDCSFTGNVASLRGGALSFQDGSVSVLRCSFSTNRANNGDGGAIYMVGFTSILSLKNSSFTSNTVSDDGGALYNSSGTVVGESTVFTSNSTGATSIGHQGGAIYSVGETSSLSLSLCSFNTNTAGSGSGGALLHSSGSASLVDCVFDGNTGLDGGAVRSELAKMSIVRGSFDGNEGRDGGALYNTNGTLTLTGARLENNSTIVGTSGTTNNGGAIYSVGRTSLVTITDCDIHQNSAGDNGGAIANQFGAEMLLLDSRFTGNTSADVGGSIYMWDATLEVAGSTFSGNVAGIGSGGALFCTGYAAVASFTNCQVMSNSCGDNGGAFFLNVGELNLTDCAINSNSSTDDGGAIFNNVGILNILRCDVLGNTAGRRSGALATIGFGADTTITDSDVSYNSSGDDGGAIWNGDALLTMENTTCSDNTAGTVGGHYGGAIYNTGWPAYLILTDCVFRRNTSGDDGGAIYNNSGTISMTGTKVLLNTAGTGANHSGGGLYSTGLSSEVTLQGCEFTGNTAGDDGGAIFNADGIFVVNFTKFTSNKTLAGDGKLGGAVYSTRFSTSLLGPNMMFSDCEFTDNVSGGSGGAVYINATTVSFIRSRIESNIAGTGGGHRGGALYSPSAASTVSFVDCELVNNIAGEGGGAVCVFSGQLSMAGTTLAGNETGAGDNRFGGAIYIQSSSTGLKLTNCTLTGNSSGTAGGAIYCVNTALTLEHVTLVGNEAVVNTGGVYTNAELTLENSILVGNTASANADTNALPTELGVNFTSGDPMLAALGLYGGLTRTMPPLPGSPVIEGCVSTNQVLDQLGQVRPGGPLPDIGAVEAFPFSSLPLIDSDGDGVDDRIEGAYAHFTVGVDDSILDTDGDGSLDVEELENMTNPSDSNDFFRILHLGPISDLESDLVVLATVKTFPGLSYTMEISAHPDFSTELLPSQTFIATEYSESFQITFLGEKGFVRFRRN